jgi:hypothetical protein
MRPGSGVTIPLRDVAADQEPSGAAERTIDTS